MCILCDITHTRKYGQYKLGASYEKLKDQPFKKTFAEVSGGVYKLRKSGANRISASALDDLEAGCVSMAGKGIIEDDIIEPEGEFVSVAADKRRYHCIPETDGEKVDDMELQDGRAVKGVRLATGETGVPDAEGEQDPHREELGFDEGRS